MPLRLVSTVAPRGTTVIFRLGSVIRSLSIQPAAWSRSMTRWTWASASGCTSRGRPRASASASRVRSSGVGPRPPHTSTRMTVGSATARPTAAAIVGVRSATTSMRTHG